MMNDRIDTDGGLHEGRGSLFDSLSWDHVRAEIAVESQARILVTGLAGSGKSTLLNSLRGWTVSPTRRDHSAGPTQEDLGLFVLLDLSADGVDRAEEGRGSQWMAGSSAWDALAQADVIVFVFDAALQQKAGCLHNVSDGPWQDETPAQQQHLAEYRWYCRIRSLGRPVVSLLNKTDLFGDREILQSVSADLERRLVTRVTSVCALEQDTVSAAVLPRLLEANPKLLVALGRELPVLRRRAAGKLINQTTLYASLAGLQPVPLLDLPLQLGLQMRMLLRLQVLYGRSQHADANRDLLASLAGGAAVRLAAQQIVKLLPLLGWVGSGILSGLSVWLLGWGAVALLEGRGPDLGKVADQLQAWRPDRWPRKLPSPHPSLAAPGALSSSAGIHSQDAEAAALSLSQGNLPQTKAGGLIQRWKELKLRRSLRRARPGLKTSAREGADKEVVP